MATVARKKHCPRRLFWQLVSLAPGSENAMKRFHVLAIVTCVTCGFLPAAAETISDLPKRKPGQWEIRLVTEKPAGTPAVVSHICIDPATDRELLEFGLRMSKKTCSRYDMKRVGKTWVIDAQCSLGPVSSATHTTISGDFQSAMTVRIEGTSDGLPGHGHGQREMLMTQHGRWIGACTNGMVPGDISMGKGIKFNVRQLKSLQKLLPKLQIR
jgi:hypothetical protein